MKVLVTGPFGNIGSHAIPELLREGHEVRCLARDNDRNRRAARAHGARVRASLAKVRELCAELGLLGPAARGVWQTMGLQT